MSGEVIEQAGQRVLLVDAEGPTLADEHMAGDLMAEVFGLDVDWMAIPVARLGEDFFRLRTGLAGAIAQRFANYRLGLVILGDISARLAASEALAAFVAEANRGTILCFAPDLETFEARLKG